MINQEYSKVAVGMTGLIGYLLEHAVSWKSHRHLAPLVSDALKVIWELQKDLDLKRVTSSAPESKIPERKNKISNIKKTSLQKEVFLCLIFTLTPQFYKG